jgi:hypothetical protein
MQHHNIHTILTIDEHVCDKYYTVAFTSIQPKKISLNSIEVFNLSM